MTRSQTHFIALAAVGLLAGFAFGFAWGKGTKGAVGANTKTTFSGGVLDVQVNAKNALAEGLASAFGG